MDQKVLQKLDKLEKIVNKVAENMATKDDLKHTEKRLLKKIDETETEILALVEKHKADKDIVKNLSIRIARLEN